MKYYKKNLVKFLETLSDDEKNILTSPDIVKKALENPVLKLLIIEKPAELLSLEIENAYQSSIYHFDGNIDVFINQFTSKVIKEFKNQIIIVKNKGLVTFKDGNENSNTYQGIFNMAD